MEPKNCIHRICILICLYSHFPKYLPRYSVFIIAPNKSSPKRIFETLTGIYVCVCARARTHMCIYVHIHMYMYTYVYACVYMYVYVCAYVCVYVHICVYRHTHMYIDTSLKEEMVFPGAVSKFSYQNTLSLLVCNVKSQYINFLVDHFVPPFFTSI